MIVDVDNDVHAVVPLKHCSSARTTDDTSLTPFSGLGRSGRLLWSLTSDVMVEVDCRGSGRDRRMNDTVTHLSYLARLSCLPTGLYVLLTLISSFIFSRFRIYWTNFRQIFIKGRYLVVHY